MIDNNTQFFKTQPDKAISVEGILEQVYRALKEKGYNPVNQIVGYIRDCSQSFPPQRRSAPAEMFPLLAYSFRASVATPTRQKAHRAINRSERT